MAEAITYCDRCSRLIPPGDAARHEARVDAQTSICAACLKEMQPSETHAPRQSQDASDRRVAPSRRHGPGRRARAGVEGRPRAILLAGCFAAGLSLGFVGVLVARAGSRQHAAVRASSVAATPGQPAVITPHASPALGGVGARGEAEAVPRVRGRAPAAYASALGVPPPDVPLPDVTEQTDAPTEMHTAAAGTIDEEAVEGRAGASDRDRRTPDRPGELVQGLDYEYYTGDWDALPDFDRLRPQAAGTVARFDISPRTANDHFGFRFSGYVRIPADGTYTFVLNSDDGSALYVDKTKVADLDGRHPMDWERSAQVGLTAGMHAIVVTYFEKDYLEGLEVRYEGPGVPRQPIPEEALFRQRRPAEE